MDHASSLIVISIAAFVLPLIADRLRIPAVVLEILFGIAVGRAGLGLLEGSEVVGALAELGFFLLMFLSGFEIDFGRIERQGGAQVLTGLVVFAATIAFAWVAADRMGHGPFVTLLLATTSVGLVVPTLRSSGTTSTRLGQTILISALLADFLTLIGATLYAMVREHGVGWRLLNFPLLFLAITVLLRAIRRLAWWFPEKFERLFDPRDPDELGIRSTLALMFVCVGLSYLLGVEPILGAFLAGTVFALVFRHRGPLEQKLSGFSFGFLIPVFFIHVGMRFDVGALGRPGVLASALGLLGAAILVKVAAALPMLLRRLTLRETLAAGVLLSTRLSLVIAVAEIGARLGLLDRPLESEVILLAVVTSTACPVAYRALVPARSAPAGDAARLGSAA